jgi:putative tryptophan/tyrosine transport system substrate-binding protein
MKRREFIAGALAITAATRASAEERAKAFRVAIVDPAVPAAEIKNILRPFLEELHNLGYIDGQNLAIKTYSGEGRRERYSEVARAVADDKPGAIVAMGVSMAREVKAVTTTIPILAAVADPIGFGLVDNLRRPGGNLTGVSLDTGPEIWGKRLELLREVSQNTSNIGVLTSPVAWERSYGPTLREAARQLGCAVLYRPIDSPQSEAEYRRTLEALEQGGADALLVTDTAENILNQHVIRDFAETHRLPAIFSLPFAAEPGWLLAFGVDFPGLMRQLAHQLDQVFRGTSPGEIPVYQAAKFELVVNLKTAKALGLTVPFALVASADKVIE